MFPISDGLYQPTDQQLTIYKISNCHDNIKINFFIDKEREADPCDRKLTLW